MIIKMLHLDLVTLAKEKDSALEKLRDMGAVHLDLSGANGESFVKASLGVADAEKAVQFIRQAEKAILLTYREEVLPKETEIRKTELSVAEVLAIAEDRETLKSEFERLNREIKYFSPFGDFDPELVKKLESKGIDLTKVAEMPARMPEMRLSRMREKLSRIENRININTARLASGDAEKIIARYPVLVDKMRFAAARELMAEKGALSYISGWIPVTKVADVKCALKENGWGALLREPVEGETPPTEIEPPKMFKSLKVLFDGLGIAPAYTEADVSVPFMCYFSIFFSMLVGDGAYGAIFLAATLFGWKKLDSKANSHSKTLMRSWLILMTVFSSATIVWGLLSNTWFGAQLPWCADWPTVKWLADPSYQNMMLLCFTIGVTHLMLARIWNGICKINDSTCVAEFGWAGILLFMYFVTNSIVGIFASIPAAMFWVFGLSLVAVFGFTVKPSQLKTRGAELGMLPLNIMSALGDIISYVRLFAVGLASVKVAENFNSMAIGLFAEADVWYIKALMAVFMVAILVIGHALNLAMAGLSILVHAVRLNTLEFSNHKGISWAGYAFKPFKKSKE